MDAHSSKQRLFLAISGLLWVNIKPNTKVKFTFGGRMVQPVQNFGMPNLNFTLVFENHVY